MELLGTKQKAGKGPRILLLIGAQMFLPALGWAQTAALPEPPQVRANGHVVSLTLHAVNENGRDAFAFDGASVAPVIRASPGDVIRITYINDLPPKSSETCAVNPCMDMTNLHFHGLTVSPNSPQDDVLGMLAMPGQVLQYSVEIPRDHPRVCFGTTLIRTARVIDRCWMECQEPSSSKGWNVMSRNSDYFVSA